jgi:hypothetical protein
MKKRVYIILLSLVLVFTGVLFISGCTEDAEPVLHTPSFTLDEVIDKFGILVTAIIDSGGLSADEVSEILGMVLVQDPEFLAVQFAYTGVEGVSLAVAWQRDNPDVFSNASLIMRGDTLDEPIPVTHTDLMQYLITIEPGTTLDYFETLLERPGILTDYIRGVYTYRWYTPSFMVVIEVDDDNNVEYFTLEVNENQTLES